MTKANEIPETRGRKKLKSAILDEVTRYRIGGIYKSDLQAAEMNVQRYTGRKFEKDDDEYRSAIDRFRKLIAARALELCKRT